MKGRIEEIDIAKGICILLMVVGHSGAPKSVIYYIYAFHMPFFFFVSGITTTIDKPFLQFFKGKFKGLVVPFLFYYVIYLLCYSALYHRGILEQLQQDIQTHIRMALWFVPILFFAQIINWIIPRERYMEVMSAIILAAISSVLCLENVNLPWSLSGLGFASAFVLLGRVMSLGGAKCIFRQSRNNLKAIISVLISAITVYYISYRYHKFDLGYDWVEPGMIRMAGALIGITMVLMISSLLVRWKIISHFLVYTGINTFVFIGLSQIVLKVVNLYLYDFLLLKYVVVFAVLYTIIYLKNKLPIAKSLRL